MKQTFYQLFSVELQLAPGPSGRFNSSWRADRYATPLRGHLLKIWQPLEIHRSAAILMFFICVTHSDVCDILVFLTSDESQP